MNRNEAREKENMNPGGTALDQFLEPLNMIEVGSDATAANIAARLAALENLLAGVNLEERHE
jgi:hypothetical protein